MFCLVSWFYGGFFFGGGGWSWGGWGCWRDTSFINREYISDLLGESHINLYHSHFIHILHVITGK